MQTFQDDPFLTSAGRSQSQPAVGRSSTILPKRSSAQEVAAIPDSELKIASGKHALVGAPWLLFVLITTLFTFVFHHAPAFVYAVAFACAMFSALCPFLDKRNRFGGQWYLKLGVLCGVATLSACMIGTYTYESEMANYWLYQENQKYTNVLPTEPAAAHADAGMMIFSDTARVDSTKAVGYRAGTVYCVAPILDDTQQTVVQFWAVGTDCCQQRADFVCDDAWDPRAKSGVVMNDPSGWLFTSKHRFYLDAVSEAEAAFNLVSAKKPILLRWVADPAKVQSDYWGGGLRLWIVMILIYLLISVLLSIAVQMLSKRSVLARETAHAV